MGKMLGKCCLSLLCRENTKSQPFFRQSVISRSTTKSGPNPKIKIISILVKEQFLEALEGDETI